MARLYILGLLVFISNMAFAQSGKITGKVINASSGQVLSNATLILIEKSKSEVADQNGGFSFSKLEAGIYSIKCSYGGHLDKIIDEVVVKNNEVTVVNISLEEKKSDAVVITSTRARAAGESVASLLIAQKNSASVSDGITYESIKKTPDRSTGDVLKRVSGASIQDDKFAIVRGLNDRYNAAFINGAPLPSTESDRKAFAFDIFPAVILDNLVIYKTATPDKSGDFAGGIIDITTKSITPKNFTSISFGGSFNSLITGKTRFFSDNKGSKDWIGIDDGRRAIPAGIPSSSEMANLTSVQRAGLSKLFENYKWGVQQGVAKPNYNLQLSKGISIQRKEKEFFGALFSLTYNRNYSFSQGSRNSYDYDADTSMPLIQRGKYKDSVYNEETVLAALANISVKVNNRNSVSWKNNLSINTDNRLVKRIGTDDFASDPDFVTKDIVRWFTSNKIFSSQLSGDHLVGSAKTKLNWLASYSKVKREIPNLSRTSNIGYLPDLQAFFPGSLPSQLFGSGSMLFTKLDENIKSVKADITQPYTFMKNSQNLIKAGGGYQIRKRDFTTRLLSFLPYNNGTVTFDNTLLALPEDQIFLPQHLGEMKNGKGGFLLAEGTIANSNYEASSALIHGYIMNDQRFFEKIRLIYGGRVESFNQKLNSPGDVTNPPIVLNTSVIDFLPSINFVYAVTPKMNIRLSYAQTINRPEFRELAPYLFYDYVAQYTIEGLDSLQRAKIKNYDFRYEIFPGKAQLFSVSFFYKEFSNPIEIVLLPGSSNNQATYANARSAKVYGAEIEFRTLISTIVGMSSDNTFLSKLTLSANAAYIKSNVKLGRVGFFDLSQQVTDRALQGQSPYLINSSLGFNDEKAGFSSTVSVNRVGDRIFIAGIKDQSADIYEKARTVVDFQLSKSFLKNSLELKFTARDLLASKINFYSDYDLSKSFTERDKYFSSYKAPKVFSFSATLKF